MSDAKNPFEDLMKMGQDWASKIGADPAVLTPEGFANLWPTMPEEVMESFMGKGLNPDGLDAKSKLLLTLQGLTIQGAIAEPQIRLTLRHLAEAGAKDQEINETIGLAGLFGGAQVVAKVMQMAAEVRDAGKEAQK